MNFKKILFFFLLSGPIYVNQILNNPTYDIHGYIKKILSIGREEITKKAMIKKLTNEIFQRIPIDHSLNIDQIINEGKVDLNSCMLTSETFKFILVVLLEINDKYPIKKLNLSYNLLEGPLNSVLKEFKTLETLDLSFNKIKNIEIFGKPSKNLKTLNLSHNPGPIVLSDKFNKEGLKITGNYKFASQAKLKKEQVEETTRLKAETDRTESKKTENIVIILDRKSQQPAIKPQDAMQYGMDDSIKQEVNILISGPILKNYLERDKKIPDTYEVYQLKNSDLYLILPKSINFDTFNLNKTNKTTIKDLNKKLKNNNWPNDKGDYKSDNWLKGIKSIFKKNTDIWWNIVLYGHGSEYFIANLTTQEFKNFIQFLNQPDINVFFFYYSTCFGGGTNLIEAYTILKNDIADIQQSKFIIVSGSTRETLSHAIYTNYSAIFSKLNELLNFSKLNSKEQKHLGPDPINGLLKLVRTQINRDYIKSNFPIIKFPNSNFFISVRKDTRVFVINYVLLQKHKLEKKPIIVSKDINVIFVYPNIIDTPIEIEGSDIPLIVSLDPGEAIHFFKEVNAQEIEGKDVFKLFIEKAEDDREEGNIFVIQTLKGDGSTYTNVVIDSKEGTSFYQKNTSFYKKRLDRDELLAPSKLKFKNTLEKHLNTWIKTKPVMMQLEPIAPWQTHLGSLIKYITEKFKQKGLDINLIQPTQTIKYFMYQINRLLTKGFFISKPENKDNYILSETNVTQEILQKIFQVLLKINKISPIKYIVFYDNKLISLPTEILDLQDLKQIYFLDNIGKITLPEKLIDRSDLIIYGDYKFEISNERRKSIETEVLKINNDLSKKLDLNQIIDQQKIDLRDRNITDEKLKNLLPFIVQINKLYPIKTISLARNKIQIIPENFYNEFKSIEHLDLSSNNLKFIHKNIGNLKGLKYLYIQNNPTIIKLPSTLNKKILTVVGNYIFESEVKREESYNKNLPPLQGVTV